MCLCPHLALPTPCTIALEQLAALLVECLHRLRRLFVHLQSPPNHRISVVCALLHVLHITAAQARSKMKCLVAKHGCAVGTLVQQVQARRLCSPYPAQHSCTLHPLACMHSAGGFSGGITISGLPLLAGK